MINFKIIMIYKYISSLLRNNVNKLNLLIANKVKTISNQNIYKN